MTPKRIDANHQIKEFIQVKLFILKNLHKAGMTLQAFFGCQMEFPTNLFSKRSAHLKSGNIKFQQRGSSSFCPHTIYSVIEISKLRILSGPYQSYILRYRPSLHSNRSSWFNSIVHSRRGNGSWERPYTGAWKATKSSYRGRICKMQAALSSFAGADDENFTENSGEKDAKYYMENMPIVIEKHADTEAGGAGGRVDSNGGMIGMSEAFHISSRTAFGITAAVSFAALVLPFFLNSVATAASFKTRMLSYVTLLCGFYMAWNIGANDVANAMGTSVGSGALTLRQAILTAAVLEFSGAFFVGCHVSQTMQKGILTAGYFNSMDSLLFCGLLSSLAAAGTWLQVASYFGWPVSTTHCIIGAMVGFGLIYGGVKAVYWSSLARVVSSWVISPILGAAFSFCVYKCIRMFVYRAPNPGQAAAAVAPIAVFVGVVAFSLTAFPMIGNPLLTSARALTCGLLGGYLMHTIIQRQLGNLLGAYCKMPSDIKEEKVSGMISFLGEVSGPSGTQLRVVYGVFGYLQVLSACLMSFAHGANDVANAIGPISAALAILHGTGLRGEVGMPIDVLAWGGFGIVAGLLMWGYRVIATIGKKITELTPTRGFAAEFAAATVVIVASRLGLPISATHTLVGAVMGVGFARGLKSVRGETVREIVASWIVTIPIGAFLSVLYTFILTRILPVWV